MAHAASFAQRHSRRPLTHSQPVSQYKNANSVGDRGEIQRLESGKVSTGAGATMATVAGRALLQCVFDRCIAAFDTEVRRRPYHRNCGCALHRAGQSPEGLPCNGRVSFRIHPSGGDLAASMSVSGGPKTQSWKTKPPPYAAK
ncbi:unnamed protein product [Musa hybrid cultivar]